MPSKTQQTIEQFLQTNGPGIPISLKTLAQFGSKSATKYVLRRLCVTGKLINAYRGFYVKPKHLESLPSVIVSCSPEDVAKLWAKENGYILVSSVFEELYQLRFQTQAPITTLYWSNGPSRQIRVGNATAQIQREPESKLLWHDRSIGRLYRALQPITPEHATGSQLLKALSTVSSDNNKQECLKELLSEKSLGKWHDLLRTYM